MLKHYLVINNLQSSPVQTVGSGDGGGDEENQGGQARTEEIYEGAEEVQPGEEM